MSLALTCTYTIVDGKGAESTTEVKIPDSLSLTEALAFAISMGALVESLIAGSVKKVGICLTYNFAYSAPADFSDVEEGAYFQFGVTDGFFTSMRIPTFLEANLIANSREVDLAEPDVAAFITAMTDGISVPADGGGTVTVEPCDHHLNDVLAVTIYREDFQSSRKKR